MQGLFCIFGLSVIVVQVKFVSMQNECKILQYYPELMNLQTMVFVVLSTGLELFCVSSSGETELGQLFWTVRLMKSRFMLMTLFSQWCVECLFGFRLWDKTRNLYMLMKLGMKVFLFCIELHSS